MTHKVVAVVVNSKTGDTTVVKCEVTNWWESVDGVIAEYASRSGMTVARVELDIDDLELRVMTIMRID